MYPKNLIVKTINIIAFKTEKIVCQKKY